MNNNLLVSIIIPCYNDEPYIEQSVKSAINQTYSNIEVIVVDDGSNKKTKRVLKKLEPVITKLITQENYGQSKARNVGIRYAQGDYILVLDSDDYFEPTFCEKAISAFLKNSDVKIVTCFARILFKEHQESYVFKPIGGNIINFLTVNSALGTSMFKKNDWETTGGYDEKMKQGFEDWEFFIRLLKDGGETYVIKEALYNYRKGDNTTTSKANLIKYDLLKYIYIKHKNVMINNYTFFINQVITKIEREEKEKLKNIERLEFKIGKTILMPLRWLKTIFK